MWGSRGIENELDKVVREFNELQSEFQRISNEFGARMKDKRRGIVPYGPLRGLRFGLKGLHLKLSGLKRIVNVSNGISEESVGYLVSDTRSLKSEIAKLSVGAQSKRRVPVLPPEDVKKLEKFVDKLHEASRRLAKRIRETEEKQREKDPDYEWCRYLRDAISKLNKDLGKKVNLERLASWMPDIVTVDLSDPIQAKRVANLYLMDRIRDQVWELRYRSKKPGGGLLLLSEYGKIPSQDDIDFFNEEYGSPLDYVIAAKLPSWRKAWAISWPYT